MQNLWRCRCRRVVDLELPILSEQTKRKSRYQISFVDIDQGSVQTYRVVLIKAVLITTRPIFDQIVLKSSQVIPLSFKYVN